jgi:hypothetical protein
MKEFIKEMVSDKDNISSKRVLGIFSILLYYSIFLSTYFVELSASQIIMANQILYLGGALLGLGIIEKFKKL